MAVTHDGACTSASGGGRRPTSKPGAHSQTLTRRADAAIPRSVYIFERSLSRGYLRYNFQKWIKNTEKPGDKEGKDSGRTKATVQLVPEAPPPPSRFQRLLHSDQSLMLCSPKNPLRVTMKNFVEHWTFSNLVFLAIIVSVSLLSFEIEDSVGSRSLSADAADVIFVLEFACTMIFCVEVRTTRSRLPPTPRVMMEWNQKCVRVRHADEHRRCPPFASELRTTRPLRNHRRARE